MVVELIVVVVDGCSGGCVFLVGLGLIWCTWQCGWL